MNVRHCKFVRILLVAALLSAVAPAVSAAQGNSNGNNGNGGGNGNNGNGRNGNDNARGKKEPTKNVRGAYAVKIAGYYTGTGTVEVAGGVTIKGKVTDPQGKEYDLSSGNLEILEDRFRGQGTLGGMSVTIDGRVDPADPAGSKPSQDPKGPDDTKGPPGGGGPPGQNKNRVLLKGRVTFTFRTNTTPSHFSRGAGDLRTSN